MILSDRVLVMNAGRIAQDGTPKQIYEEPRSRFVMDFLGQVDHVAARVARTPDGAYVAVVEGVEGARVPLRPDETVAGRGRRGPRLSLRRRPRAPGRSRRILAGRHRVRRLSGRACPVRRQAGDGAGARRGAGDRVRSSKGTPVQVQIPMDAIRAWPAGRSPAGV